MSVDFLFQYKLRIYILYVLLTLYVIFYGFILFNFDYSSFKFCLPFLIISQVILTAGIIYFKIKGDYVNTLLIFFIAGGLMGYIKFIKGNLEHSEIVWTTTPIALSYILLPLKRANQFAIGYTFLLVIMSIIQITGNEKFSRPFIFYINVFSSILAIIATGNIASLEFTKKLKKIEKDACTDPLTGLFNRRYLEKILNEDKKDLSLIMIDLDHFKKINDTYGHGVGDIILKKVAQAIKDNIRETDIPIRIGGEEFVIILPDTNIKGAKKVAEKIKKSIEQMEIPPVGHITASFGITQKKEYDCTDTLIKRVDEAMYKAKKSGRNRIEILL